MYLGPEGSAIDLDYLRAKNIDRVLVAADFCEQKFILPEHKIEYMILKIDDSPAEDLARYFNQVHDFIT